MHIQFVSKGIDVSPALRERFEGKVEEGTAKYFNRPGEAFITATKEGFGFKGGVLASPAVRRFPAGLR